MKNNNDEIPEFESTLSNDIKQDFQNILNILKLKASFLEPESEATKELKQMHSILYIYRSICNDLFVPKKKNLKISSLTSLNQHLLISALLFVLKNDNYTAFFLLRGSLEASIKIVQYGYGSRPTDSFSNNLEQVTKKIKDDLISNIKDRNKKKLIKNQINKFTSYGREVLYGSLSDKIHIREDINVIPSVYLNNFFEPASLISQNLSSLFITTIEYETVFTMLNIGALKSNKISYSEIEYFRSNYKCFEYLIKSIMKLL